MPGLLYPDQVLYPHVRHSLAERKVKARGLYLAVLPQQGVKGFPLISPIIHMDSIYKL